MKQHKTLAGLATLAVALSVLPSGIDSALAADDSALLNAFASPDSDWSAPLKGATRFDSNAWRREDQGSGVEFFFRRTDKKNPKDEKRVVVRDGATLNSVTRLAVTPLSLPGDGDKPGREVSAAIGFRYGKWTGFTRCTDSGDGSGRTCTTITPAVCGRVRTGPLRLSESESDELDRAEVRAIALILALRGDDHQLDNVVRYGNRMGLKHPKQTTKGRLLRPAEFPQAEQELTALCGPNLGSSD